MTTKKENLRKCKINYALKEEQGIYYFHGWSNESDIRLHPEDPQKDVPYSYMVAVIENIETGEVSTKYPTSITFIS